MKPLLARSTLFAVALGASLAAPTLSSAAPATKAKAAAPAAGSAASFAQTQKRIDAMLGQRLKPDPLPDKMPSPFELPPSNLPPKAIESKPVAERFVPTTDSEMLLYYGAGLRISGTVITDDKVHLIINQAPFKEGDTLTLKTKDGTAKLRVIAIAPGELTIGLNDAVQVIKFKK